jgi:O-antigen ligase
MKKVEPPEERLGAARKNDLAGRLAGAVMQSLPGIRDRADEGLATIRSQPKWWFLIPLGVWLAWWAGSAVASGGSRQTLAVSVAALAVGVPTLRAILGGRIRAGFIGVEAPLLLISVSTLVFRGRSADELAYSPLDPAAQFRVLCVALAMILSALALISRPLAVPSNGRATSLPIRLFFLYVVVVFLGAPQSFSLALTGYRGVELLAGVMIVVGARHLVGDEAGDRIGAVLYWFTVGLLLSVWVGYVIAPQQAIVYLANQEAPIPFQIRGLFPSYSANGVGTLGVLLTFWSLGRLRRIASPRRSQQMLAYAVAALGLLSLVFAQYRTGYGAFVVGLLVYLLLGRRWLLATGILLVMVAVIAKSPSTFLEQAEPFLLRGQSTEQASTLSSRVDFWTAAVPVWEESPLIGKGLLTGTRFEVLAPLGYTYTSGIHSTWVEALVGTGVIGLVLLFSSFLITYKRAYLRALRSADLVPVLLLTVLGVRSLTGNTFETFSFQGIIFLWLALDLSDERERTHQHEMVVAPATGAR